MRLDETELPLRPFRILRSAGIETVEELARWTREELLSLEEFGQRSLTEVEVLLATHGLRLRKTGGKPWKMTQQQVDEAAERYRSGEPIRTVAPKFNVSVMTLYRYFRESGVVLRGHTKKALSEKERDRAFIERRWMTAQQAAESLGIGRRSVCDLCRMEKLEGAFRLGDGLGAVWLIPRKSVEKRAKKGKD